MSMIKTVRSCCMLLLLHSVPNLLACMLGSFRRGSAQCSSCCMLLLLCSFVVLFHLLGAVISIAQE
jgi:hypothetical protein